MAEFVHKLSICDTLAQMQIGETMAFAFSVVKGCSVRSAASTLGLEMDRRYSVHANRDNRTYEVTRHE